jgi:acetyl-CoA synthetase
MLTKSNFKKLYKNSLRNPDKFWTEQAKKISWFTKWDKIFVRKGFDFKWFEGGKLNITYNCLDRHVKSGGGSKTAYIWINEKGDEVKVTYHDLLVKVNQISNFLISLGLKKGDTLTIYMPLTVEQIAVILACARVGIIHSVVFAGFSYQALNTRVVDAKSRYLVTADFTYRRGEKVDLLSVARRSVEGIKGFKKIIVFKREKNTKLNSKEIDFASEVSKNSDKFEAVPMDAEDKLFILYTSGTTGKPKGIVHTTAGYNLYTHITTKYTFDLAKGDIFWCTADPGWITGHSYVIYGLLSNHATSLIYEGAPNFPDSEVWWRLIEKYKVSIFYTSPTAIRMLMSYGIGFSSKYDLKSLKVLGSVGEPLNPAAWKWYFKFVGRGKCPLVDTWWQTETGGQMITTLPGFPQKPGYAGLPYFGFEALVVGKSGKELPVGTKGFLVIKGYWPSMLRDCWNARERFEKYFTEIPGFYFTGDIAIKDKNGYIRILGRSDDIIIVAGHNIGSAELEAAITSHKKVAEAAVIGIPDEIKGNKIVAYVTLKKGSNPNEGLANEISEHVGGSYGKHGKPEKIVFVDKLPKTRSGKIMRRVLRAKEGGGDLGDTSTLEE